MWWRSTCLLDRDSPASCCLYRVLLCPAPRYAANLWFVTYPKHSHEVPTFVHVGVCACERVCMCGCVRLRLARVGTRAGTDAEVCVQSRGGTRVDACKSVEAAEYWLPHPPRASGAESQQKTVQLQICAKLSAALVGAAYFQTLGAVMAQAVSCHAASVGGRASMVFVET